MAASSRWKLARWRRSVLHEREYATRHRAPKFLADSPKQLGRRGRSTCRCVRCIEVCPPVLARDEKLPPYGFVSRWVTPVSDEDLTEKALEERSFLTKSLPFRSIHRIHFGMSVCSAALCPLARPQDHSYFVAQVLDATGVWMTCDELRVQVLASAPDVRRVARQSAGTHRCGC